MTAKPKDQDDAQDAQDAPLQGDDAAPVDADTTDDAPAPAGPAWGEGGLS